MKRAAIEKQRTVKTWRNHLRLSHANELAAGIVTCVCDKQVNRFRKAQKQLGCGHARCYLCHGDKLLKRPTRQELKARDNERDQIKDIAA